MLFSNPPLLALLVNESRARDAKRSGDIYARNWIEPQYQDSISKLWMEFSQQVYSQDDIVLSVRTRIIQNILNKKVDENTSVIILPCGFVSYAFMSNKEAEYIELDLEDLIQYKSKMYNKLQTTNILPKRNIKYISIDLAKKEKRKSIFSKLTLRENRIFILEGISYYLKSEDWWNLLLEIKKLCRKGDIIIFDYWNNEEKDLDVYERFRLFCNQYMMSQIENFLFMNKKEIINFFKNDKVKIESVFFSEYKFTKQKELRQNNILNDTFAIISIN